MISKSKKISYTASFDASSNVRDDLDMRISFLKQIIPQNADTPKKVLNLLSKYYDKKYS